MVPNIEGTEGYKARNHIRHRTPFVIEYPINRNPAHAFQENVTTAFGHRLYNSLPKYLRDVRSVKTENFKLKVDKFLELILNEHNTPRQERTASLSSGEKEQIP